MRRPTQKNSVYAVALFIVFLSTQLCFSQEQDSTLFFKSAVSVTQNGFSFIPSFSLGKPALIFEPSIGNKRLSFEPQFRFALEGKPWSFIFIYRYKAINRKKFQVTMGAHIPAIVFSTQTVTRNGTTENVIISQRFIAAELVPNFVLTDKISLGMYLLRGHGFDKGGVQDSYFVGFRSTFSKVKLVGPVFLRFIPQAYYLKTDDKDGYYFTYTLTVAMKNFPLSITHILNQAIQTEIPAKKFDWNVSLVYSFDKNYIRK